MEQPQERRTSKRRPGRVTRVLLLVGFCLLFAGFALRRPLLEGAGSFLNVTEEPRPADLIFILGGDMHIRPSAAAELYRDGFAPRIVMSRVEDTPGSAMGIYPNETDASVMLLTRLGVPDSAIVMLKTPGGVTSTREEADQLHQYLDRHPASRVLVVTSDYHTRRTRWLMESEMSDLPTEFSMYGATPEFDASNWWRSETGFIAYMEEYAKFVHNSIYR